MCSGTSVEAGTHVEASVAMATGAWGGKSGGNALTTSGRARLLGLQNERGGGGDMAAGRG